MLHDRISRISLVSTLLHFRELVARVWLLPCHHCGMTKKMVIHIVDGDPRSRIEQFHFAVQSGFHGETYNDVSELKKFLPQAGVILLNTESLDRTCGEVIRDLAESGIWPPIVATGANPSVRHVVWALKAGALDYLALPLPGGQDEELIFAVLEEAIRQSDARRRLIEARDRLSKLSVREREVLDYLVEGNSNKAIARAMEISPRTVEIHRANMMGKLGAKHPADAVRIRLEVGAIAALAG